MKPWRLILYAAFMCLCMARFSSSFGAQIQTQILAPEGEGGDNFGQDLKVYEDYLVVGAPNDDNANGSNAGAVYIFKLTTDGWVLDTLLLANDGAADDLFGYSVDLYEDDLLVGSCWDDDAGEKSGSVHVYRQLDGKWTHLAKLVAADASEDDRFGIDAAIYGDYILVGAFFDDTPLNRSGSAYLFKRTDGSWTQQAKLTAVDGSEGDWFGVNVSLRGDDAAVGARNHDGGGANSGAVYVFHRSGNTWPLQAKIFGDEVEAGDEFSVPCIFGNSLVVGVQNDDDKGSNAGAVYYFQRQGTTWTQMAKFSGSDCRGGECFGCSISLTADFLAVGAYSDDELAFGAGSVYLFKRIGLAYFQEAKIIIPNPELDDNFGQPVSMYGDVVAAGTINRDVNGAKPGVVYAHLMQNPPYILSVSDVPYDQGGTVAIRWSASFWDIGRNFSHYSIWRASDGHPVLEGPILAKSTFDEQKPKALFRTTSVQGREFSWEWIADCPGHRLNEYAYSAPTLFDSSSGTDGKHYYMVSVHLENSNIFYDSNIDSGYSVDNLAPLPPTGLMAVLGDNRVFLNWDRLSEPDLSHYIIYRDHTILSSTPTNVFQDSTIEGDRSYLYQIQAADVHGNAGGLSEGVSVMTTSVAAGPETPRAYALFANYPNPFNPGTQIRFAVPKAGVVVLKIINTLGEEIATLYHAKADPGIHPIFWDGKDKNGCAVSSGIYFSVLQAGTFREMKKMTLLR